MLGFAELDYVVNSRSKLTLKPQARFACYCNSCLSGLSAASGYPDTNLVSVGYLSPKSHCPIHTQHTVDQEQKKDISSHAASILVVWLDFSFEFDSSE